MQMKILVTTWFDKACEYDGYFLDRNRYFCKEQGVDFIHSSERTLQDLRPHWERIPLVKKHLPNYDYVLWVDGDAHVTGKPLVELVGQNHLLIGKDIDREPDLHRVNSGVFLLKNTPWSFKLLDEWLKLGPRASLKYKRHERTLGKRYRFQDQGALRWMFLNDLLDIKSNATVLPYGDLQHFSQKTSYVVHYAGPRGKRRLNRLL